MFVSDRWTDYALLDCGKGERLERWGKYKLIRPDPQAMFQTERDSEWDGADAVYFRSPTGGGRWENRRLPERWSIRYRELTFNLKPMSFKHTGLFPEQAANWDFAAERIRRRVSDGRSARVLNLFAYTGAATASALSAGAQVCHVDAARGMVAWAKENLVSCGLENAPVRFIVDDCEKFVQRELRRGSRYDAIIMDPPSYGRGPSGEVWKLEEKLYGFCELCAGLLSDDPDFVMISSYSTGLSPSVPGYILGLTALSKHPGGKIDCGELGLPAQKSGMFLPCGSTARLYWGD